MTTSNNISSYIKDTEDNIRQLDRTTNNNTWATAVDTGTMFLIRNGALYQWKPTSTSGTKYTWGTGSTQIQIDGPVMTHFDADNSSHMLNQTLQPVQPGESITRLKPSGAFSELRAFGNNAPIYKSNVFGTKPGLELDNCGFVSDSNLSFHGSFTVMMVMKWLPNTWTNYFGARSIDTAYPGNDQGQIGNEFDPNDNGYSSSPRFWGSSAVTTTRTQDRFIGSRALYAEAAANTGWQWYVEGGGINISDNQDAEFQDHVGMENTRTTEGANGYTSYDLSFDPLGLRGAQTPIIMTYRYEYNPENTTGVGGTYAGLCTVNVNGGYRNKYRNINMFYKPTLQGLKIGEKGTHSLGELLIVNAALPLEQINRLGTAMASKWGGQWYGVNY